MTRIISLANQKGGVSKSTTLQNLICGISILGKSVIAVDLDPQANTTSSLGFSKNDFVYTIYDCLAKNISINEVVLKTRFDNIKLIPSNIDLTKAEAELLSVIGRENLLKKVLSQLDDKPDFILIDCPPSLGVLSCNALVASNSVIIPVEASEFSLSGIEQFLTTFELVRNINPDLELEGVLLTRVEANTNSFKNCYEQLTRIFGSKCYDFYIPRNQALADAQFSGNFPDGKPIPAVISNPTCKGALMYTKLSDVVINNAK